MSTKTEVIKAFGNWLSQYHWDWFCTLTFSMPVKDTIIAKKRFKVWIDKDVKPFLDNPGELSYFVCVERFHEVDNCHLHALLAVGKEATLWGEKDYFRIPFWARWRYRYGGMARIEPCGKGASYYVSKYVTKDMSDWDICLSPVLQG